MANESPLSPGIPDIDKGPSLKGPPTTPSMPKTEEFQTLMKGEPSKTEGITPLDLAKTTTSPSPSIYSLIDQTNTAQTTYNKVKQDLQTPNLSLKRSHEQLLNSKFSEANDQLSSVAKTLNANQVEPQELPTNAGPVTKFLSYISDGQNQLLEVKRNLESLRDSGESLQPGQLMLIQVKLAQAQQSIEYSSVLLSKLTDILKQLIQIQI